MRPLVGAMSRPAPFTGQHDLGQRRQECCRCGGVKKVRRLKNPYVCAECRRSDPWFYNRVVKGENRPPKTLKE